MRWTTLGLVALGLVAAVCAAVLVAVLKAQTMPEGMGGSVREVTLVVAAKALPTSSAVDGDSVTTTVVPQDQAPADYVPNAALVVGKVLALPMVKGQVFTKGCFVTEGSGAHLAAALPEGKRAVSVPLSKGSSLEGLLYPGSVVDVMACLDKSSRGGGHQRGWLSIPLLECIPVLAVETDTVVAGDSTRMSGSSRLSNTTIVTLMVDMEQAQALQLAMTNGNIMLAMRNPLDRASTAAGQAHLSEITKEGVEQVYESAGPPAGSAEIRPAVMAMPPSGSEDVTVVRYEVVVIRGGVVERVVFPGRARR